MVEKQHNWKVVPISTYQRLDVRAEDLLNEGLYRKCNTYRGGGGYDKFPSICRKRLGFIASQQFVVQLYGCNLDCPYCYVTRSGIWGEFAERTTDELISDFLDSKQDVFHLMGGAPALYLNDWPELMNRWEYRISFSKNVFHSDFLLTEKPYAYSTLSSISNYCQGMFALFAVDIKGVTKEDYEKNTRKEFKEYLFWSNLEALVRYAIPFYITFTNPDKNNYDSFVEKLVYRFGKAVMSDSFIIDLVEYNALPFVDILPKS